MQEYIEKVNKFNLNENSKKLISNQIKLFYDYNYSSINTYKVGDKVKLTKNNLIHGTRANLDELEMISKKGLIASEFYLESFTNKKKPYVVEFWKIDEHISLHDWINKYAGVTIEFYNREGNVFKNVICSIDDIKQELKKENDFRDYIIVQNQEQRFVPNDYINNESNLAFIIEYKDDDNLIKNDIFDNDFNQDILVDILPEWFYEKYMKNKTFDNHETGREKAIIFGIPRKMIKGIVISKKYENDIKYIEQIKLLFNDCYICDIKGNIIVGNI